MNVRLRKAQWRVFGHVARFRVLAAGRRFGKTYRAAKPNESDLRIELISGGSIALRGADNYDALRGDGLDFIVLDEYASMAPQAWSEVLRPALSDRRGRALFIGTPH